MKVNKDNPQTWIRYKKKRCNTCIATCCTMPVEVHGQDLVRLDLCKEEDLKNPKRVAHRLQQQGLIKNYREKTQLFTLASQSNGDCIFLDKNRRCTVYEKRPDVCRKFPTEKGSRLSYCPYIPRGIS